MGKKYIIELEDKPVGNSGLYKVKGFNSLVFDQNGLNKLEPYIESIKPGDILKHTDGTFLTVFIVKPSGVIEGFTPALRWLTIDGKGWEVIGSNENVKWFIGRYMR